MTFNQRSWRRLVQGFPIPSRTRPQADRLTPDASATPHVDLERFRADLRAAGVEEMVGTLLETFMEDCPGRFAALEQAIEQGNAKDIESAAHAFKSGSGTIRASVLAAQLGAVEASAHEGRLESIATYLEQIRTEQAAVLRELEEFLGRN